MRPTLIFSRHGSVGSRQFAHGDELPPDIVTEEIISRWLDEHWLREDGERRSLYRMFDAFSGCKEHEELTTKEKHELCL
jgi:hypothetical protein